MNITVLSGGEGPEREVSLRSGAAVAEALSGQGHEVAVPDLKKKEDIFEIFSGKGRDVFAFIALHGGWGEDGTLQAALEMLGVPFSGSGHGACALAMDKTAGKALLQCKGIAVPKGIEAEWGAAVRGDDLRIRKLLERSGRIVVKPCCCGSTVGVSILDGGDHLEEGMEEAFRFDPRVIVEEYIPGRELTVTVWDPGEGPRCLPVIEILPVRGFYDYNSKYTPGECEYRVPAPLPEFLRRRVEETSLEAHRALGCTGYSRVDLRLGDDGLPVVLEVNTVPGMTATSLVPKGAAAGGITFGQFLDGVITSSLQKRP